MLKRCIIFVLCLTAAFAEQQSAAKEVSAGLSSSPTGYGVMIHIMNPEGSELDILNISTDLYGLVSGRTDDIGFRLGYSHDYVINRFEYADFSMDIHAGAGLLTGFVHDHESGIFFGNRNPLEKEMGLIAALSCSAGLRFDFFARKVAIDLGFSANPGVHIRMDKENGSIYMSFYKNGIYQILYPKISIMYRF